MDLESECKKIGGVTTTPRIHRHITELTLPTFDFNRKTVRFIHKYTRLTDRVYKLWAKKY